MFAPIEQFHEQQSAGSAVDEISAAIETRLVEIGYGMGVYLTVGGALLFAAGVLLSIYRERLLSLPNRIRVKQGLFTVLGWR